MWLLETISPWMAVCSDQRQPQFYFLHAQRYRLVLAERESICHEISLQGLLRAGEQFSSKIGGGLELRRRTITPPRSPRAWTPTETRSRRRTATARGWPAAARATRQPRPTLTAGPRPRARRPRRSRNKGGWIQPARNSAAPTRGLPAWLLFGL
jgi:hypothetical protein